MPEAQPKIALFSPADASEKDGWEVARQLQDDLQRTRSELQALRQHYKDYYGRFRFRLVERVYAILNIVPLLVPALCVLVTRLGQASNVVRALVKGLVLMFAVDSPIYWIRRHGGLKALAQYAHEQLTESLRNPKPPDLHTWFGRYRPAPRLLAKFRARSWPAKAPKFSIVLRLDHEDSGCLHETLHSVASQTYSRWELICVSKGTFSTPVRSAVESFVPGQGRVHIIECPPAHAGVQAVLQVASGDYICLLDQGDALEPQALHRFAETILGHDPDLLYGDGVTTNNDLNDILSIEARPAFSYDYLLSSVCERGTSAPWCLGTWLGIKASLLRDLEGHSLEPVQDAELLLHVLEKAKKVAHMPDILHRRRRKEVLNANTHSAVADHLQRLGCAANAAPAAAGAGCEVRFWRIHPGKVAIIIPTKNRHDLLRRCVASLEATVPEELADVYIIDHDSDEPATREYLHSLQPRHRVLPYSGAFNFSAIMNHGVAQLPKEYSHYLLLNNDTEALSDGWLEHMMGLAQRREVGIVGAILLYPDRTVQHAGVVIGLHFGADHVHKGLPAYDESGRRSPGPELALSATRDLSAVTGACLLICADVFAQLGGFDEGFAVGFGDIDLCLRAQSLGYKVLLDAQAVLLHYESATRGSSASDPHPQDTSRFRAKHLDLIVNGDPYYSPLLSRRVGYELKSVAIAKEKVVPRIVSVVLPKLEEKEPMTVRRAA